MIIELKNRKKIIEVNHTEVITEYYDLTFLDKIKSLYEKIETNPYVPKMSFDDNKIITSYSGESLDKITNLDNENKIKIKSQLIEFIKLLYEVKIAHRDLHIKNICWDGNQIWIIDWEIMSEHSPKTLIEHYDLTGKGLASPYKSGNMNILKKNYKYSVSDWLKPITLTIDDFKEKIINNDLK